MTEFNTTGAAGDPDPDSGTGSSGDFMPRSMASVFHLSDEALH